MPEFAGARKLHALPSLIGRLAYRKVVGALANRPRVFGTFAVTSLGHRPVDGFHSVGGTTITLGLGRIADRPVVRDGKVVVAPVMRLSLAFDHRVIDGAEAADVLAEIVEGLQNYGKPAPVNGNHQVAILTAKKD
jgi:pyruvate/2-oxoglutarate dehydrogenase complex dihydrolipoamide acyltransferase (E2) component